MAEVETRSEYEHSDASVGPTVVTGIGIIAVTFVIGAILAVVLAWFWRYRAQAAPQPPAVERGYNPQPPEPRLQQSPTADFEQYRAAQTAALQRYSWIDREHGVVSLPISRAMELISQRGIPPQTTPPDLKLVEPHAGTRLTGFEGKVGPE